jgi:uncharacterized protein (DUF488 family)
MTLLTIGFTRSTAEHFFRRLADAGVRRVVDVRLNNTSQLSGFAKLPDLPWFLKSLCGIDYRHEPLLAPEQAMLDGYKKRKGSWAEYEARFTDLLRHRSVADQLDPESFEDACLLCSEAEPHFCHRRLVAEHLESAWGRSVDIRHL